MQIHIHGIISLLEINSFILFIHLIYIFSYNIISIQKKQNKNNEKKIIITTKEEKRSVSLNSYVIIALS